MSILPAYISRTVSMLQRCCPFLAAACLLNGCAMFAPPGDGLAGAVLPRQWQHRAVTGMAVAGQHQWWKNFNDPLLDELIDRSLRTNNDLAAATIRVHRAWLKSRLMDTSLTPSVAVSGESLFSRDLKAGADSRSSSVAGTLSYEIDLWGKLARSRDSSRWEAQATDADRRGTALALIGTTASAYWQVAYLNQRIALNRAGIDYAEKTLALVRSKYDDGAVSSLDLVQSAQKIAAQQAALAMLLQQRIEARTALAILFDQAPQNSLPELQRLPDRPLPGVEAGIPAALLGRRPDLQAAEMRLRKYLADVDVTRRGYYPTFTLTGNLGGSSTSLANVVQNPVAALGVGLVLPFLQWNTARLNVKVSESIHEEAVVNFRQTLYGALRDVENALSANLQYQQEGVYLERSLGLARQAEQLAEVRYRAGATGLQVWLDLQETRRNAESSLAQNRLNRHKSLMTLYLALGGDMVGDAMMR